MANQVTVCGDNAIYVPSYEPGGDCDLISRSISANGTYVATNEGADGYSRVVVDVAGTDTDDATLSSGGQMLSGVTAYARGSKYTGTMPTYSGSVHDGGYIPYYQGPYVITPTSNSQSFSMSGLVMSSDLTVLPQSGIVPSGNINISSNGTYDVSSYANAVVSVSGGGGSNDNFLIAIGAMSGSVYDTAATEVGSYAFYNRNLANGKPITGVEMTSVSRIGREAFESCDALATASFPECTYICREAFNSCSGLTTVNIPLCTTIESFAFAYCYSLTSVNFPVCTSIGSSAFINCRSLATVSIPKCITINSWAFSGCSLLTSANFPSCTHVYPNAFYACYSLSSANFPACTYIGASAFYSCHGLHDLYLLNSTVASLVNYNAFAYTPMSQSSYHGHFGSIYVPSSLVDSYKAASNWSVYSNRITAYTG